jgi:hypothetical protein
MALKGIFEADFTPFTAAVAQAQVSLKSFEGDGAKVETRLNSLTNSLSGVKIVQQATLATEAVTRLGDAGGLSAGLLKLTDSELQRVGASAQAAADKLRALGQDVPAGIQQIADAAKAARTEGEGMGSSLSDVATSLAAKYLSFEAVMELVKKAFDFAKEALASAAALEDLSRATGISTDGLQRMSYVAKEFGVDQETMARGVETFSMKLAESNPKAVKAVTDLGLSVKDLIAAGPEEAFLQFAEAAGQIENPMRKGAEASDAFGARLAKNLLPMLGEIRTKMQEVPQDALISEATIKSAHDFEVGLEHLDTRVKAYVADQVALWMAYAQVGMMAGQTILDKISAKVTGQDQEVTALLGAVVTGMGATAPAIAKVTTEADILNNHLAELRKEGLEKLLPWQKAYLDQATKANESAEISATYIHASVAAIKTYEEGLKAATEAAKKHQEALDAETAAHIALTSAEQGHVEYLQSLGLSEEKIANLMGKNVVQIHAYIAAAKEADAISKMWGETFKEWAKQAGKAVEDTVRNIDTANAKEADAIAHQNTQTMATMRDFHDRVAEMNLHGTDLALAQIDRQQRATNEALDKEANKTTWYYLLARTLADAYYQHLKDLATGTAATIEERMRQQGVFTKNELEVQANNADRDYRQMVEDGGYTASQLSAQWQKMNLERIAADDGWAAHAAQLYDQIGQELAKLASVAQTTGHAATAATLTSLSGLALNLKAAQEEQKKWAGNAGIASALFSDQASGYDKAAAGIASGVAIAGGAMNVWTATANAGSKAAGAFKGAMAGGEAGAAFGPWGAAVGAAAGAITGFIHNLTAGRNAVEAFATAQGGFDALHAKLDALPTGQGEVLWKQLTQGTDKGNPQQAQANIDKVTAALAAADQATAQFNTDAGSVFTQIMGFGGGIDASMQPYIQDLIKSGQLSAANVAQLGKMSSDGKPTYQQLDALAQKYNLTLDQMGAGFQQSKLSDEFQSLIDDMDELNRGGVDMNGVLTKIGTDGTKSLSDLGTQVQSLIDQSQKYGVAVPENMKPAAQSLIDQGLLLDANGQKITDINQIKFGESMQTSLDSLNKTLQTLIDTLTKGPNSVKGALDTIGNTTVSPTIAPKITMPTMPDFPTPPAADWGGAQAAGGDYYVTRPTWFLAGEAGPERASFGGANKGGGGPMVASLQDTHISIVMPDGRTLAEVVVPHIPIVVQEYGLTR